MAEPAPISKKRKFVQDGLLFAEINEFLTSELAEDGYAGCAVRVTPSRTEVVIKATRSQLVLGERGQRIRELTSVIRKRFGFEEDAIELLVMKVQNKGLCAIAQAEALRYKLSLGLPVRRACYGVVRNIMESDAKGCEVTVSGKLRAQRAKVMKFQDGYMIRTGDPAKHYLDQAVRHVQLRQGVLGIRVIIMLPFDATGAIGGCRIPQPDFIRVLEPKDEVIAAPPTVASYGPAYDAAQQGGVVAPQEDVVDQAPQDAY